MIKFMKRIGEGRAIFVSALCLLACDILASSAPLVSTHPWLQNVYTNRFTVMCETQGEVPDLRLQYGEDYAMSVGTTCTNGVKEGTFVCKASVTVEGAEGETVPYRLAVGEEPISGTEGSVRLWKDEDAAFTCAIWGDNQEGVQKYDWGFGNTDERYRCIHAMFSHMAGLKPDFGFTTGDMSSEALYDEEILPGELRGVADLFGNGIPYHLVWGNHDCIGTFLTESYTNAAQRYFSPAASEKDGWFHLYRNDVLFIGVHWTWGSDDADERYGEIAKGVEALLATDRAKKAKFRILVQHAPIFLEVYNVLPKADWFSDTRLLDVAKAGGVDVVFSGHTHAYERIEREGIVQVVNGGMGYLDHGERWYNNYGGDTKVGGHRNTPFLWARQDETGGLAAAEPVRMGCFQGYGMLSVAGDTLTYRAHAFNADGSYVGVADAFELKSKTHQEVEKAGGQWNGNSIVDLNLRPQPDSPVDNATWAAFKQSQGESWTKPAGAGDEDPVVNVSKTEIGRFCAALNAGGGHNYRLMTVKELTEAFGGDLRRDVSEWTADVDPDSGWCRILGGNRQAADYTWCREFDKPAMASPDCHANYLGFRLVDAPAPAVEETAMDKALAALAEIENPAEVYLWNPLTGVLEDITDEWTRGTPITAYGYSAPVIFTGRGALAYSVGKDIAFGGGLAAPHATSLDFSHPLPAQSVKVTVRGEFRGGIAEDEWRFYLKCDKLVLDNVAYRGQVFNAVTDDRSLNLIGTNDFSGAVMSICVDRLLADPQEDFVTNLVADADATLRLDRLDFSTRGVVEEVLGTLTRTAGFTIGKNVTLTTAGNVLFGIKGAKLTVDGALDAAGVDIAGHLLGLLPQEATLAGSGAVRTTHFGMCDKSTLYVGVPDVTLLSSVPYRSYTGSTCNIEPIEDDPTVLVVTSTKEIPKVARGAEVTFGEEGKPAVIDFQVKNATFSVGANAKYALVGTMLNAKTVRVAAGTKTRVDGVSVQNTTEAALGALEGTSVLAIGSDANVALDSLVGTEKSDRVTVGAKSVFKAGDLSGIERLTFASCSSNEIGNAAGVRSVILAAGKSATSKASAVPSVLVAGDLEMLSDKANAISLGKNTESSFGDVLMGGKNDRISVGDSATALFGRVTFGGGRDTLTVGKNSTVVMAACEDDCASLTKFAVGKGTTAYLSSELIAKGKALAGSRPFGDGAKIVDLGPAEDNR